MSCAQDSVLPGAQPTLLMEAACKLRTFSNLSLWQTPNDKKFSAFEGDVLPFESLLSPNVKMFRQEGIREIKKM